jgi:hypothetical protein
VTFEAEIRIEPDAAQHERAARDEAVDIVTVT